MRKIIFLINLSIVYLSLSIADDESRYAAIDRHALNAPASVTKSIKTLSSYLTKPFSTDEEKARAIFRWIANNISYDVKGYFSGDYSSTQSGDVLESRSSVCAGYSSLFEALGKEAGLEVASIDGYAKGFAYEPGDKIPSETNHAWNAIKINGEWKLVDCTWGAGSVDYDHSFKKEFEPYYFFTKPEEFIYRHLPTDEHWQLLKKPVSQREFQNLPFVSPNFFECELVIQNKEQAVLDVQEGNVVEIYAPTNVYCMASLEQKGRVFENAALIQRTGLIYRVRVRPPTSGEYFLNIFAKRGRSDGSYPHAIKFKVITHSNEAKSESFPVTFAAFLERNVQLQSPITKELPSGSIQIFSLTVANADRVAVVCGEEWDFLKKHDEQFEGRVEIDVGRITVFAQYPDRQEYQALLEYQGTGSNKRAPSPIKYERYMNSGAEIVGPLRKELIAGSPQFFRIKLPGATKAAIIMGQEWNHLKQQGEYFEGTVEIKKGKVILFATYQNSTSYEGILEYEGK